MTHDDSWARADAVLEAALEARREDRPAVLDRLCEGDTALRERVECLLAAAEDDSGWLRPGDAAGIAFGVESSEPAPELHAGMMVGPFEVTGRLGAGGMGVIYGARDSRIGREVAIKLLPPRLAEDRASADRFMREAKIVARLNHTNILTVYEVDRCDAGMYIVSEIVDGPTLRQLARNRVVSVEEATDIFRQVAAGLAKAHAAGVIHRDVKPDNLMVTRDGVVKILDFGIAKVVGSGAEGGVDADRRLTRTGVFMGTPGYIAPEVLRGEPFDRRSDLFALGVVIYELLAGEHPYPGKTVAEMIDATLNHRPPPLTEARPDVPAKLAALVDRCLDPVTDRRPADADELVRELQGGVLRQGVEAGGARGIIGRLSMLLANIFREENAAAPVWDGRDTRDRSPQELVVAVFPIADRSGESELETAGAGRILTDLFLHLLTDGARMYTVAPSLLVDAAYSEGRSLDEAVGDPALARKLGRRVGGNAMLTGTFEKLTGGYVVSARIVELESGRVRRSYRAQAAEWEGLLTELAKSVQREKKTPEAVAGERLVEKLPSRSLEAYAEFVRGRDLADMGQFDEALPSLTRAVELDPELAVAWSEMGCAYYFKGDHVRSRAAHWKAAEHVNHASLKERLWIAAATAWVHTENGELYRRRLQEFIDAFPDDRDGPFYMGHSYLELDNDAKKAIPWLEKACELTPTYYPPVRELAEAYGMLGDRGRARDLLDRYLHRPGLTECARASARQKLEELVEGSR